MLPTSQQYYEVVTVGLILPMRTLISESIRSVSQTVCVQSQYVLVGMPGDKAHPDSRTLHSEALPHESCHVFMLMSGGS